MLGFMRRTSGETLTRPLPRAVPPGTGTDLGAEENRVLGVEELDRDPLGVSVEHGEAGFQAGRPGDAVRLDVHRALLVPSGSGDDERDAPFRALQLHVVIV